MTQEWQEISRVGEPELIRGPSSSSLKQDNEYKIYTTLLPAYPHGYDWMQFFTSQFTGQRPYRGWHDGKKTITIECSPDDAPGLTKAIDAAIEYANGRLRPG